MKNLSQYITTRPTADMLGVVTEHACRLLHGEIHHQDHVQVKES